MLLHLHRAFRWPYLSVILDLYMEEEKSAFLFLINRNGLAELHLLSRTYILKLVQEGFVYDFYCHKDEKQ